MRTIVNKDQTRPMSRLEKGIRRDWLLIVMLFPCVLCIAIFSYVPMFGVLYSFQDVGLRSNFWENDWVGLKWFEQFFGSIYAERVIKNTLILNGYMILFGTLTEIVLALIFNEVRNGKFKKFTQSCTYFPNFLATTVVVGMMVNMLNPSTGVLSGFFQDVFGWEPIDLFVEPKAFRPMYIISSIWQGAGWGSIVYMGAINGIDPTLYEAAAIDGAGRLQRIRHVTLPGMKAVFVITLIMHVGSIMSLGSGKILLMYGPSTYETADVISTFVYRNGISSSNFGYGAAVGLFNSLVNTIMLVSCNWVAKKVSDTSMF